MISKLTLLPLVAITAAVFSTVSANAQCDNSLVTLAHNIDGISAKLQLEFRSHYAHSGAYPHLMADVAKIRAEASHIDGLAHNPHSSLRHIQADLQDLDRLAHHLHDLVDAVECGRFAGHVDGNTHHVHSMLSSLNANIHQMERVVAAYSAPVHQSHYGHTAHSSHRGHSSHNSYRSSPAVSILRSLIRHHGH